MRFLKPAIRVLAAAAMVWVGIVHFREPETLARIVPGWLPAPVTLVYVSGFFEILGGLGLLLKPTRLYAAWGLVALYIAVYPANINMAVNHVQLDPAHPLPEWALWLRLPFQALFIALALWLRKDPPDRHTAVEWSLAPRASRK